MKKKRTYTVVLTHDIDHLVLRNYSLFSREVGSFIKNCIFSNLLKLLKNDIIVFNYVKSFIAGITFPLVKMGLFKDPMEKCLEQIIKIEKEYNVRSTFYFIPFKDKNGFVKKGTEAPENRGTKYNVLDYKGRLVYLDKNGWEVGIHGINAHIDAREAKKELMVFKEMLPDKKNFGVRIHWLYLPDDLWKNLNEAGFFYDTTYGSNKLIGFRENRLYPFKKDGIWVLPLNIQDGTLLAKWNKNLSQKQSWKEIEKIMNIAKEKNAILTILWHNASFGPPRYWGDVYKKIIEKGKKDGAQFLTALEAIEAETQD